jgi:hypothetical protein
MAQTFTITGRTATLRLRSSWRDLLRLRLKLHLIAEGTITGYFEGVFTFDERVTASVLTLRGTNQGRMLVTTPDGSTAQIAFGGDARLGTVRGSWQIESGTGDYSGLEGQGTYTGDAALRFSVEFQGELLTS